jgi:hypothetical protein
MLYLARESLLRDRLAGMAALGIGAAVADTLLELSIDELLRLAQTPVLLVGLRWNNPHVWSMLRQFASGRTTALPQALVLAESEEGLNGH